MRLETQWERDRRRKEKLALLAFCLLSAAIGWWGGWSLSSARCAQTIRDLVAADQRLKEADANLKGECDKMEAAANQLLEQNTRLMVACDR